MDFWTEFTEHSLYSPWLIQPEGEAGATVEFAVDRVFVFPAGVSDAAYTMLGKMVAALGWLSTDVAFLDDSKDPLQQLPQASKSLKVVFFGDSYPGHFGEAIHWQGHQVIQTHALQTLLLRPELKRDTWNHLKLFASLK